MKELKIEHSESEIKSCTEWKWKKYINEKIKEMAFEDLVTENETKEKNKHIVFQQLKLREYLESNISTVLSKIIFGIRSGFKGMELMEL